ncbi:6199_t:CDS:10 [Paraglomus occultum]|uniref:6199_t:CDS:1 n=1 Tax=Paraglomus occultum TaxID=144539 RepID=A0A9N8W1K9_9GLOM|nr:6199_t:CDS:10 [Paraglomus occultum]
MSSPTSETDGLINALLQSNTKSPEEITEVLGVLSIALDGPQGAQVTQAVLSAVPLPNFFTFLESSSESVINAAGIVLEKLLRAVTYVDIVSSELKDYFRLGLSSPLPKICLLTLGQIEKCLTNEEYTIDLINSPLYDSVIEVIGNEDIPTATRAADFVVKIAENPNGLQAIFDTRRIAHLNELSERNDTLKFRVIDLLSRIANISDEAFHLCESSGALYSIVTIFHSKDILLRLNAVESFIQVAETPTGYMFLKRTRIIESLIDMLALDESDVVNVLLKCGAIKFFGRVEAVEFEELAQTHELLKKLAQLLESDNLEVKITTVIVLGNIGSTQRGLVLLDASNTLQNFLNVYHASSGEVKLACLRSLSCFFDVSSSPQITTTVLSLYASLSPTPLPTFLSLSSSALSEVRFAIFSIFVALSKHSFARHDFFRSTYSRGFLDFILNRTTEKSKEGKEWKFSVVEALWKNQEESDEGWDWEGGARVRDRLLKYIREGPFHVHTEAAVALESG